MKSNREGQGRAEAPSHKELRDSDSAGGVEKLGPASRPNEPTGPSAPLERITPDEPGDAISFTMQRADSPRRAATIALGVTAATAAVITFAFDAERAGSPSMLLAIGVLYTLLTLLTLLRLQRRNELIPRLRPAFGDLAFGAMVAGIFYGVAQLASRTIAVHRSPREAWIIRLYLQLGDPRAEGRIVIGLFVFAIAALEEIVWRGLVMHALQAAYTTRSALLVSSVLFAAAHLPTLYLLRDPMAGPNPLIALAALGCGLGWGLMYARTGRLVPAIFAHALFSWCIVEFPLWRP